MQVLNSLTGMPQRFRAAMREKFFKPQKNNSGSNEFSAGLVAPRHQQAVSKTISWSPCRPNERGAMKDSLRDSLFGVRKTRFEARPSTA
jgi:hypothetical protein